MSQFDHHYLSDADRWATQESDRHAIDWDPEFLQSRREFYVILLLFTVFACWSLGVCYWMGYAPPASQATILSPATPPGTGNFAASVPAQNGYGEPKLAASATHKATSATESIWLVFGMPAWVFWGIALPWLAVDLVAFWFCFFYMTAGTPRDPPPGSSTGRSPPGDDAPADGPDRGGPQP